MKGMNYLAMMRQRCPRCLKGAMFESSFKMKSHCPVCEFKYEREEGYYTGAMFINWFFAVFLIGPVWVSMLLTGQSPWLTVIVTTVLLLLCTPLFFRYSRVLWLYFDFYFFHPE